MKIIVIDQVVTQPDSAARFPQYLLCRLLEQGPALLEADGTTADSESVEWRFTPHKQSGNPALVVHFAKSGFRSALARFGLLCGISPYGGHSLFQLRFTEAEKAQPERFAIYLCNEPTMGFWIRVYLYGIDGAYPNHGGMFAKNIDAAHSEI